MRFKGPEFVAPSGRLLELTRFANTKRLGPLFQSAPDIASRALSKRDFDRLHERVVANLDALIDGLPLPEPVRLVKFYRGLVTHGADFDFDARQFKFRYEFPTLEVQISFLTLLLLANVDNPVFPGGLSRCKYAAIGEGPSELHPFFFATERKPAGKRGPKPRTYCSEAHRDAASVSTPRVEKHRIEKAKREAAAAAKHK